MGNVTTHLLSCSSLHTWFTPGECQTVRDDNAQMVSLYFSYSMDVLTDLMSESQCPTLMSNADVRS